MEGGGYLIQKTGINRDYGIFDLPDAFYAKQGSNLSGPRRILYALAVRYLMNARMRRIREQGTRSALRDCGSSCDEVVDQVR